MDLVHVSEISIIEAKAKSLKLGGDRAKIADKFNEGLTVLAADENVVIHGYRAEDDKKFSEFLTLGLGFFDTAILAQSCTVGVLLTEDSRLLQLKATGVKTINWAALLRAMSKEAKGY